MSKNDSRFVTLSMFRQGKSIEEICIERRLVQSTIEGHLSTFVRSGELDAHSLVPKANISQILGAIKETGGNSAMPIREKLGDEFSYAEIRVVLNYWQWMLENNITI